MRENPFKSLRVSLGLSQKEVAQRIHITSQVVLRNEQGIYTTPNVQIMTVLLNAAAQRHDLDPEFPKPTYFSLTEDYLAWVKELRRYNGHIFDKPVLFKLGHAPVAHPFKIWRSNFGFSRIGFCKLLALHPSIVQSYEEGTTGPLPTVIREALVDAGIQKGYIRELEDRCLAYAAYKQGMEIPAKYVRDSDLQEAG